MEHADRHCGYTETILRVNLTKLQVSRETPSESYYRHYLGGRGVIMHTLLSEVPAHADPLGPENRLIFAMGLLTGHRLIGTAKCSVGAKSPAGGTCGESEAGGFWGPELKKAGYDAIVFEGIADRPVYLRIENDDVELRDAGAFWGQEVRHAMEGMMADAGVGRWHTALIGPGGEKQVGCANIIADCKSAFGRGGMGAVMGSKRLKGIVVRGDNPPSVADEQKVVALNRLMAGRYKNSPFHRYGTGGAMKKFEEMGNLPIRNHTGGEFPNVGKIDAVTLLSEYGAGMEGCFNCPIRCKKKMKPEVGALRVDPAYGGAEYETLASFGSNLLIDDLPAICKAHEMCNRYGIDTISTGSAIAFAMECFENGILNLQDTDGMPLKFGDAEAMLKMVEKIAGREGLGDLLSKGVKQAADVIGKDSAKYAMHVKGLSIPYHDPRYKQGLGLHYSVHGTGADHCSGVMDDGLPGMMGDWESINVAESIPTSELSPRKVRMAYELGLYRELFNHLGLCNLAPWSFSEVVEGVKAITGWKVEAWKLMKAVERGITLMRIFNLREGFTREDDRLPDRFYSSPAAGPLMDLRVDPDVLKESQGIYFQLMGWDINGVPTRGCLVGLDMDWAWPYLRTDQ